MSSKEGKIKKILMWVTNTTRGLPSEYQEVEYIEGTGTQYLDTGVSAPNGFKTELKVLITAQVGQTLIGSHNVGTPYGRNNINTFTVGSTWGLHMNDEMINSLGSINFGHIYEIEGCTILGASYLTVDGVRLATGTNTSPMSSNNILLLQNQYGLNHGDSCNKAKIYSCKIYNDSETLVRDLVPCYRKADDVIGMYDIVNDVFYTNSGTGIFTKGSDVLEYVEKQVRPTGYRPGANTIAYFPFKEDAADKVGSRTLTLSGCSVSDGVMNINSQASYMLLSNTIGGSQITGSVWYYYGALSTGGGWNTLFAKNGGTYHHILMPATTSSGTVGNIGFYNSGWYPSSKVLELGKWYHIVFVKNGTNEKIYINAELVLDSNSSFDNNSQPLGIISSYNTSNGNQGAQGKMSELFFENKIWNIDEITDYYNQTKHNYPN